MRTLHARSGRTHFGGNIRQTELAGGFSCNAEREGKKNKNKPAYITYLCYNVDLPNLLLPAARTSKQGWWLLISVAVDRVCM